MAQITNPILRGFNPDPSILRVGDDYFIATSTFEWFPGVRLHHSRDLVNFRTLGYALTRTAQLDLTGVPGSGGVWAPCLSYDAGTFYLVYTNARSWAGAYGFDTHNYLVTARDIAGPWSDPVSLHSRGFDPSLFHDSDGRKWLVSMAWDHRQNKNRFAGIELQEYLPNERRLIGPVRRIFAGTELGITEGPHLYRRGDYYYLITAEGGTGWNHAVSCARSRNLFGPYEVAPNNPVLTSRNRPELLLQKAGHASLVETPAGELYLAHLCARPAGPSHHCILGRETALQRAVWTDDAWLQLAHGTNRPLDTVPAPALSPHVWPAAPVRDDFDTAELGVEFQTLRIPPDPDWLSLTERRSHLRLRGRESPGSRHRQSLVARRVQSLHCRAETAVEFAPATFLALAGLVCWYDTQNHYYLAVTFDDVLGRCLRLIAVNRGFAAELGEPVALNAAGPVVLEARLADVELRFFYRVGGQSTRAIGPVCDATILSDEHPVGTGGFDGGFTGAFVGMAAHDMSGGGTHADFDYFIYEDTA